MLYRAIKLKAAILVCMLGVAAQAPDVAAKDLQFGLQPSFASSRAYEIAVSDDRKAFTVTFSDLEASIGNDVRVAKLAKAKDGKAAAPIVSKVFSLVLPVSGAAPDYASLYVSGFALTTPGAQAVLLVSVNGQNTVVPVKADSENAFVEEVKFQMGDVSELRMTAFLLVERDSADANAAAYLNVNALDTDLAKARQRQARAK